MCLTTDIRSTPARPQQPGLWLLVASLLQGELPAVVSPALLLSRVCRVPLTCILSAEPELERLWTANRGTLKKASTLQGRVHKWAVTWFRHGSDTSLGGWWSRTEGKALCQSWQCFSAPRKCLNSILNVINTAIKTIVQICSHSSRINNGLCGGCDQVF